ncbi:FAD-dependent oxidoreductase [Actinosynnema sp. NPDC020468]|uniref:oxidoreductase n=1 Tax=Actinosynnema sp. NPDC020468 TaxID=3154488 RepID=UPI003406FAEB
MFRPGSIGSLVLPNRIVMGAMHLNLECRDDGAAAAAFYAERARGEVGLIITGGCAVNYRGGAGFLALDDPRRHPALAAWASAVHAAGGRIALQLFHAGRYTSRPVAPSAVPSRLYGGEEPEVLTDEQVKGTVADFAAGAVLARDLGFDAVEVMGSEGYLVNQFRSPVTNLRADRWGEPSRFPLEVVRAIRAAAPGFPLLFRMSAADLVPGSTSVAENVAFAVELARAGVDAIDLGVGWHESRVPTVQAIVPHGAWVGHAAAVKRALVAEGLGTPVIAANRINRIGQAAEVLTAGAADFVSMARPLLADPLIVAKARTSAPVNVCVACNEACVDRSLGSEPVSCMVNPRAGREWELPVVRTRRPGRYAVVGAGPAGLEAARVLAELGHEVEVFEADAEPGGQFRWARLVPGKEDFGATVDYLTAELRRFGVPVHLSCPVTEAGPLVGFTGVVLATGVRPRRVDLPGADLPHVVDYRAAFTRPDLLGDAVAVIGGGGIAVDLAHLLSHTPADPVPAFLAEHGLAPGPPPPPAPRRITVLRRSGRIGAGMGRSTRWAVVDALRRRGVDLVTGVAYRFVARDGVHVVDADGADRVVPADSVVVAAGQEPEAALVPLLVDAGVPHVVIGGAADARGLNAVRAFTQALESARALADSRG